MPDHLNTDVLLVGAGPMAQAYAQVLKSLGTRFAVAGRGAASAQAFEAATGFRAGTGALDAQLQALPRPLGKAVVAVSAANLTETTLALIEAGARDLLVEKPAGLTPAEVARLADAARAAKAHVAIAYNRRFYAATRAARAMIAEDGGPLSVKFDFTEATRRIEALRKDPRELAAWFYGNSTHVVDLAFHLAGEPEWLEADSEGGLAWHPAGAVFAGHGRTRRGALASWHADWLAPGRWGVEVMTARRRLVLQPMEELFVQVHGSFALAPAEIDYAIDKAFKPGLHAQVAAWLDATEPESFLLVEEHAARFAWFKTVLEGGSYRPGRQA